jgi:hypothetical protein
MKHTSIPAAGSQSHHTVTTSRQGLWHCRPATTPYSFSARPRSSTVAAAAAAAAAAGAGAAAAIDRKGPGNGEEPEPKAEGGLSGFFNRIMKQGIEQHKQARADTASHLLPGTSALFRAAEDQQVRLHVNTLSGLVAVGLSSGGASVQIAVQAARRAQHQAEVPKLVNLLNSSQ